MSPICPNMYLLKQKRPIRKPKSQDWFLLAGFLFRDLPTIPLFSYYASAREILFLGFTLSILLLSENRPGGAASCSLYCRGTVFLSSRRCYGAMRSGAAGSGDGDEAVTRNKGGIPPPFSFIETRNILETSSEGFTLCLQGISSGTLDSYTYRYTHSFVTSSLT
jgi:hypothetical protein